MAKNLFTLFVVIVFFNSNLIAQSDPPKREMRAAWIASVASIDWPSSPTLPVYKQKQNLTDMLDVLKSCGINAVFLQIRPECDALYESNYEPWSYWLTGSQGNPPVPYYDPLAFAIEEAHKRGLELHAWFNPYRAEKTGGSYSISPDHVTVTNPDWILTFTKDSKPLKLLDPGLPMVREYVTNVIMDVVNNYDISGVHFDDYFYPYPPNHISQTNDDLQTYQNYKHGDASDNSIGSWRRENVNILMRMIHDSIQVVKPHIKFGISPFGIYKWNVPPGIKGMDAYNTIYADPLAWLNDLSVDYLTPQLYWKIGGDQDFYKLMNWWADQSSVAGRHLYTGHIFSSSFTSTELPNQLNQTRNRADVSGNVWFSAKHFDLNSLGFAAKLKADYYRYKSLVPTMSWKDSIPPNEPNSFAYGQAPDGNFSIFQWDLPDEATDGDSAFMYAVYRFDHEPLLEELNDPANLFDLSGRRTYSPIPPQENWDEAYFVLTSLDRNYNESATMSNSVVVYPPETTQLAGPEDGNSKQADTLSLHWRYAENTSSYKVQISEDSTFSSIDQEKDYILDTMLTVTGFNGQQEYYWRVAAQNPAGTGDYSEPFKFRTAFPGPPLLSFPENGMNEIPLDTTLYWHIADSAYSYRLQLSQSQNFQETYIKLDTIVYNDTSVVITGLEPYKRLSYYWRVMAFNDYGSSNWSETSNFRTVTSTSIEWQDKVPLTYQLNQNYPNPFNPSTIITFSLAKSGQTILRVFDILGRQVAVLKNENLSAGQYSIQFDGTKLASGVYIYQLISNDIILNKKMVLMK